MPYVPNPTEPGGRKPVKMITDRAKRYRAQKRVSPAGRDHCHLCGNPSTMVDHIDGNEDHGEDGNLMPVCRPCNTRKAAVMRRAGLGKKTRQYNPQASQGARTLSQWTWAVARVRRRDKRTGALKPRDGWKVEAPAAEVKAAVEMIRATPPERRAEYAAELRSRQTRRGKGGGVDWMFE